MTAYEKAGEQLSAFLPTLLKLQNSGFKSSDETYWRSRWHEWVNPHSDDNKAEFERKQALQLIWTEVWYYFNSLFCQKYHIPDRMRMKTHLVTCQQLAEAYMSFVKDQNQPVDEPENVTLWYLRYHLWNETIQHGGLAAESLWAAAWPLIKAQLRQIHTHQQPVLVIQPPKQTPQLNLFADGS